MISVSWETNPVIILFTQSTVSRVVTAIDAMWEHLKSTQIPSLELYVEEVPLGNVVASNPSPTPMPILTQKTVNPVVSSASCTFSQPFTN